MHYGETWKSHSYVFGFGESPTLTTEFHVYAVEWTPIAIEWFLDGNKFFALSTEGCFPGEKKPRQPFDIPFGLIFNLAVGGNFFEDFPGDSLSSDVIAAGWPDGKSRFEIDNVRIFARLPVLPELAAGRQSLGSLPVIALGIVVGGVLVSATARASGAARRRSAELRTPLNLASGAREHDSEMAARRPAGGGEGLPSP